MLDQRGEDLRRSDKPAERKPVSGSIRLDSAPVKAGAPAQKRKLSFKEKHALETLPKTMEQLQSSIASFEKILSDPLLFSKDPSKYRITNQALAEAQSKLAAAEEQWLELEMAAAEGA